MTQETLTAFIVLAFCYGAMAGSFLNVVIYRLPRMKGHTKEQPFNLGSPRSTCPQCDTMIAFYDNIPIISFMLLRGKCRHCHNKIPCRYVFIELSIGVVAAIFALFTQHIAATIALTVFVGCGVALACIYHDKQPLPRSLSLVGLSALLFFLV